jgi:hypothetical protein
MISEGIFKHHGSMMLEVSKRRKGIKFCFEFRCGFFRLVGVVSRL